MRSAPPSPSPQRAHRPHELGPRLEQRGRWWTADLRPWGGRRYTSVRNPTDSGWPERGDRTQAEDVARRWAWAYVDAHDDERRRAHLGRRARASRRALGDVVETFLAARTQGAGAVAYCTARGDATPLRRHLVGHFGADTPLDSLDVDRLQRFFDALAPGREASTLGRYRDAVRALFTWAGREDVDNPALGVQLADVIRQDVRTFDADECGRLRDAADRLDHGGVWNRGTHRCPFPLRRALEMGLGAGLRQAELFALDWGALRERDVTVRVRAQIARDATPEGTWLTHLKGKRARTTLVLPSWWAHHARHARGRVLPYVDVVGPGGASYGARLLDAAYRWGQQLYDAAGVNAWGQGWHALRHTYAKDFVEAGGRLEELQSSLGHESIATTERYYKHLTDDAAATLARARIYGDHSPTAGPRLVRARSGTRSGTDGS